MNPRFTIAEVAERLGTDREAARGIVRFLVEADLARERGVRRAEPGGGAPQKVYDFSDGFEKVLAGKLARAKLT